MLKGRKIVVLVSGGIAAYKAVDLCSRLKKAGAEVRVAMTRAAGRFVQPLSFEAVVGHPVYSEIFGQADSHRMEHIEWARWADDMIAAPASADFVAKLAAGIADDAPLTLHLAFRGRLWIAPAMNTAMWEHSATQENLVRLRARGAEIIGPGSGPLACGDVGEGRLAEPEEIVRALVQRFAGAETVGAGGTRPLAGRTVLITSGPTRERLDPIRFISNRSTGKMGAALAESALRLGARVILVSGPTSAPPPPGVELVAVETAEEMLAAVQARLAEADAAVFAAAVANYRPAVFNEHKFKGGETVSLELIRNPDIAGWAGAHRRPEQLMVGFTAESRDLLETAERKLRDKKMDLVFANLIGEPGVGFGSETNEVTMLDGAGGRVASGRMSKTDVADWIWARILERAPRLRSGAPAGAARI